MQSRERADRTVQSCRRASTQSHYVYILDRHRKSRPLVAKRSDLQSQDRSSARGIVIHIAPAIATGHRHIASNLGLSSPPKREPAALERCCAGGVSRSQVPVAACSCQQPAAERRTSVARCECPDVSDELPGAARWFSTVLQ
eukprot:9650448-Lingulodinium_polyedra.AAC.1